MVNDVQVGDVVCCSSWRQFPPRHIQGDVIKVAPLTALVQWRIGADAVGHRYWHRGRNRAVPEVSRKSKNHLVLIERRGGPW